MNQRVLAWFQVFRVHQKIGVTMSRFFVQLEREKSYDLLSVPAKDLGSHNSGLIIVFRRLHRFLRQVAQPNQA